MKPIGSYLIRLFLLLVYLTGAYAQAYTYDTRLKIKVKNPGNDEMFKVNTDRISTAYGVLLMNRIPVLQRYISMAEILARGR
ncbi:MAG: hypothetical protein GY731_01175 [Gammaproteobacteria bacterium]|nr:hypothetical protein [Gammaproteobacteria bacterium]